MKIFSCRPNNPLKGLLIVLSPRPLSSSSFTGAILTQSQQGFHILERNDRFFLLFKTKSPGVVIYDMAPLAKEGMEASVVGKVAAVAVS